MHARHGVRMAPSTSHPPRSDSRVDDPGAQRPPTGAAGAPEESEVKKLKPSSLVVSGAAAATASVVGGQLGVAGTVIGAALTSVVSATAIALYTDSVTKGKETLQKVQSERPVRGAGARTHSSRTAAHGDDAESPGGREPGPEQPMDEETVDEQADTPSRGRRVVKIALLAAVIALIGVVAVFGIQRVTGVELSPGTGEIQRTVGDSDSVAPRGDSEQQEDRDSETEDGTDPGSVPSQQEDEAPTEQEDEAPTQDERDQQQQQQQEPEQAPREQRDAPAPEQEAPAGQGGGDASSE